MVVTRRALCLVVGALCAVSATWTSPQAGAAQDEVRVQGFVTVNGIAAPTGARLSMRTEATDATDATACGSTRIDDGGQYALSVATECPPQTQVVFVLDAIEQEADEGYELTGGIQNLDIQFSGISAEDMASLGVAAAAGEGDESSVVDAVEGVANAVAASSEASTRRPLITDWQLFSILLIIVVGTGLLLMTLARRPRTGSDAGAGESGNYQYTRRLIEGLVLTEVLVAVIILGVTGKVSPEGVISVLAAITGYAIGKSSQ